MRKSEPREPRKTRAAGAVFLEERHSTAPGEVIPAADRYRGMEFHRGSPTTADLIRQVFRQVVAPCALALLIVIRPSPSPAIGTPSALPSHVGELDVCVIVPRLAEDNGPTTVPLSRPTLFTAGPLLQIRIERDGRVVWHLDAPANGLIQGPIGWPLAPVRPDEKLRLLLRPPGAAVDAFAVVPIQGASASVQASRARSQSIRSCC